MAGLLVLLLVQTALVLGGVAYMLEVFGDELDATLDEQVSGVQRDLDVSFDEVAARSVREELDRRLPARAVQSPAGNAPLASARRRWLLQDAGQGDGAAAADVADDVVAQLAATARSPAACSSSGSSSPPGR